MGDNHGTTELGYSQWVHHLSRMGCLTMRHVDRVVYVVVGRLALAGWLAVDSRGPNPYWYSMVHLHGGKQNE